MPTRIRIWSALSVLAIIGAAAIGFSVTRMCYAQPAPGESGDGQSEEVEFANPETARLQMYVGPWRVTETHFNTRGEPVATVKGKEQVTWILEHRAIRRTYQTKTEITAFEAIGTFTYSEADKSYRGVWFDNVSTTGPTTVEGEWDEGNRTFIYSVESTAKDGSKVDYKVIEEFPDEERRIATTYLLRGSEVIKRLEVQYKRYVPCPTTLNRIFGG